MWSAANILNGYESNFSSPRSHICFQAGGLTCPPCATGRLHRWLKRPMIIMCSNVK